MRIYHIQYDGESYFVEAESLPKAVEVWKFHVKTLWGDDWDGTEEPESIHHIHDGPVLREER